MQVKACLNAAILSFIQLCPLAGLSQTASVRKSVLSARFSSQNKPWICPAGSVLGLTPTHPRGRSCGEEVSAVLLCVSVHTLAFVSRPAALRFELGFEAPAGHLKIH